MFHYRLGSLTVMMLILVGTLARADVGVTAHEIVVGSTGALSGSNAQRGKDMALSLKTYFDRINARGGIHGRKIRYLSLDDGYDPMHAMENAKKLTQKDHVFALIGGNGTPTAKAILRVVKGTDVPWLFPGTGAGFLRDPVLPNVFNLRVGYSVEARDLIDFAVKKLGLKKVGVFYQNDAYGNSGQIGVRDALAKYKLSIVRSASYERNSENVKAAVDSLRKSKVQAVFMQAVSRPAAAFVWAANRKGFHPLYLGPSPMSPTVMKGLLRNEKYEMYLSQVVPFVTDTSLPIVRQFRADIKPVVGKRPLNSTLLEGYLDAVVFVDALKRVGSNLTRARLDKALEAMKNVDIGGLKISFSSTNHQGLDQAILVHLKNGKTSPVNR